MVNPADSIASRYTTLLGGPADARGPEVGAADDGVLEGLLADDVGDRQPPTGTQHAGRLGEHRLLVRAQVDHPVGDHAVDAAVIQGECLDAALAELDLRNPGGFGEPARLVQLLRGEVDPVHVTRRADQAGGVEGVQARAAPEVDDTLSRLEVGQVEEVPDTGERLHGTAGYGREPVRVVPDAQGHRRAELEVEPVVGLLRHVPVHVLDLGLELLGVHGCRHCRHLQACSIILLNKTLPCYLCQGNS
jgi:hypothetical protein